jgi:hypothetical protein
MNAQKNIYKAGTLVYITMDDSPVVQGVFRALQDVDFTKLADEFLNEKPTTRLFVNWLVETGFLKPVEASHAHLRVDKMPERMRLWSRPETKHPSGAILPPARLIRIIHDRMSYCVLQVFREGIWQEIARGVNLYLVHKMIVPHDTDLVDVWLAANRPWVVRR